MTTIVSSSRIARGGEVWVTAGTVGAAALNYSFTLLLTLLLSGDDFAVFAAGQALLLVAGTVAAAGVPWVLAQAIARSGRSPGDRSFLLRFAFAANGTQGVIAAGVLCAMALSFADAAVLAALATATVSVFLSTVAVGWAQGLERFRLLAALVTGEVVVKVALGAALVELGAGPAGAIAGACAGASIVLIAALIAMRGDLVARPRRHPIAGLMRGTLGMVSVQALVTGVAVVDLVLSVALLGGNSQLAGYTLAATLGRAPLFLGLALSLAVFPALSRNPSDGRLAARSLRTLLAMALPLLVVAATAPAAVLDLVLPAKYAASSHYLPYTLCSGTAFAIATLQVGWLKAIGAFGACLRLLLAGTLAAIAAVAAGALLGGMTGVAVGALAGSLGLVAALARFCLRRWPDAGWALAGALAAPALALPVLLLARPHVVLWSVAVVAFAAYAALRLRETAR
jgi:O-antigen/teichoic acid export membrane protein